MKSYFLVFPLIFEADAPHIVKKMYGDYNKKPRLPV